MRNTAWLVAVLIIFSAVSVAGRKVEVLDGTSWKLEVDPIARTRESGATEFKEVLTFADGKASAMEGQKQGYRTSAYSVSNDGEDERDWNFSTEQDSVTGGKSIWRGTIRGSYIAGKLIRLKPDGTVLVYTFNGQKLLRHIAS